MTHPPDVESLGVKHDATLTTRSYDTRVVSVEAPGTVFVINVHGWYVER